MTEAPFGVHALPARMERLRRFGLGLGTGSAARSLTSAIRRACLLGRPDPFDVEPFPGQCARLHPRDNLSEKRVFGAVQFWDAAERAALMSHMGRSPAPFVFVDAGANVGLYTLAVRSFGPMRGAAIEPDPENLRRLRFNLAASGATEVAVVGCALSDARGEIELSAAGGNRGEICGTSAMGSETARAPAKPLLDVVREAGLERIDAMKIDIEGMEEIVLRAFFERAPKVLYPGMIVLEARRGETTPALAFLTEHGYTPVRRTKMNAILTFDGKRKDLPHGQA